MTNLDLAPWQPKNAWTPKVGETALFTFKVEAQDYLKFLGFPGHPSDVTPWVAAARRVPVLVLQTDEPGWYWVRNPQVPLPLGRVRVASWELSPLEGDAR